MSGIDEDEIERLIAVEFGGLLGVERHTIDVDDGVFDFQQLGDVVVPDGLDGKSILSVVILEMIVGGGLPRVDAVEVDVEFFARIAVDGFGDLEHAVDDGHGAGADPCADLTCAHSDAAAVVEHVSGDEISELGEGLDVTFEMIVQPFGDLERSDGSFAALDALGGVFLAGFGVDYGPV